MKHLLLTISILFFQTQAMAVDPSQVLISVYAVAISASADCSSPIVILDNGSIPVESNFLASPVLGSGNVTNGTYPCVMIKMSDVIRFKPASTTGSCTGGTLYTIDVCRAGSSNYSPMTISGTSASFAASTACTGTTGTPANDSVTLFISTQSTNTGGGGGEAFVRPAVAGTNGFQLNGALTVSGGGSGTFVVNFNGKIDGTQASCDLQAPVFGFR